jgi:lipoprotein-anchoring transpeptidase ErfK/SrfK
MRTIGLLSLIIAGTLVGVCGANSAPADPQTSGQQTSSQQMSGQQTSGQQTSGQVWSLQTPFGIVYGLIPHEVVDYPTTRAGGTIVVSTSQRRLYYVLGGGKAIRYGIAVGMEGYAWSGVSTITAKREWPDWTPTPGERKRFPTLPPHMAGGSDNPLGARALYLGDTLYRIHGTNEPWKLGGGVSSGCIRMSNDDITDLYNRAKIGATVIVQR